MNECKHIHLTIVSDRAIEGIIVTCNNCNHFECFKNGIGPVEILTNAEYLTHISPNKTSTDEGGHITIAYKTPNSIANVFGESIKHIYE